MLQNCSFSIFLAKGPGPGFLAFPPRDPAAQARALRRKELERSSPRQKRLEDAEAWRAWMLPYRQRLLRERRAAAAAAEAAGDADGEAAAMARRVAEMNGVNPRFVLRQHMAEQAIRKAQAGDFTELKRVAEVLRRPYADQGVAMAETYAAPPPDWSHDLILT